MTGWARAVGWYLDAGVAVFTLLAFGMDNNPLPRGWYRRGEFWATIVFVVLFWPLVLWMLVK